MSKKRKPEEQENKFNPLKAVRNELQSLKNEDILKLITEKKEHEWESLPVVKRYETKSQKTKEKIEDIIFNHHHHPVDFDFELWIGKEFPEIETPLVATNFDDELMATLQESEFYGNMEKLRMKQHPIFQSKDLREIMIFFMQNFNTAFNFFCTRVPVDDCVALIANICGFDMVYFCIVLSIDPTTIQKLFKPFEMAQGIYLLQYNFNSESIQHEEKRTPTFETDSEEEYEANKKKKRKKMEEDNMQLVEYKNLLDMIGKVHVEIYSMFYFQCTCLRDGRISAIDARKCINNED